MKDDYQLSILVEAESRKIIEPYLDTLAYKNRWVWNGKGRLAKELQQSVGDILLNITRDELVPLELKAERKPSKNLFLEVWSNLPRFNPGWMWKSEASILLYHFLGSDELYSMDFQKLKKWFHDPGEGRFPRWACWPLKKQCKYAQKNETWGVIMPIDVIGQEVGFDLLHPANSLVGTVHRPSGKRAPMTQLPLAAEQMARRQRPGPREFADYAQMMEQEGR